MDDFMKYIAPEIWPKGKRTCKVEFYEIFI